MMKKWLLLFKALRKGSVLAQPAKWKTQQIVVTALAGTAVLLYQFSVALGWAPAWLTQSQVVEISTAVGTVLFVVHNITATVATTDKIGLRPKPPKPVAPERVRKPRGHEVSSEVDRALGSFGSSRRRKGGR